MRNVREFGTVGVLSAGLLLSSSCGGGGMGLEPRFVAVHNTMTAMGLAQTGSINEGSLGEGTDARMTQHLEGGQCYTYVGLGSDGVDDLDVRVLDDTGAEISRDGTRDRQAATQFCPDATGDYQVVIRMQEGSGEYTLTAWSGAPRGASVAARGGGGLTGQATCQHPLPLELGRQVHGDTSTGANNMEGSCAGGESAEHVYVVRVDQRVQLSAVLQSSYDGALYIQSACGDSSTQVDCNDDNPDTSRSQLDVTLDPGTYYLVVDGYSGTGEYDLIVSTQQAQPIAQICGDAPPLTPGRTVTASTAGQPDSFTATCGRSARGADRVYRMDVAARSRVRVRTQSTHDAVLYMRSDCTNPASEIACNDDLGDPQHAMITAVVDPGTYFIYSDGYSSGVQGDFTLTADTAPEAGGGAQNDACGTAGTMAAGAPIALDTFTAVDDLAGSCGGQGSPDVVQRIDVPARSHVRVSVATPEFSGVMYLRRACADTATEVACTAFAGPNGPSMGIMAPSPVPMPGPMPVPPPGPGGVANAGVLDAVLAAGTYYLVVDGVSANDFGAVQVSVSVDDVAAAERSCRQAPLLRPGQSVSGSTLGTTDRMHGSCAGGTQSNDQLYRLQLRSRQSVRLTLSANYDAALYLRRDCLAETSEIACNDDSSDSQHSYIETTLDAGTYYVVVDGFRTGNQGNFTLDLSVGQPGQILGPTPTPTPPRMTP